MMRAALIALALAMPAHAQAPVHVTVMLDCGTLDGAGRVLLVVNGVPGEPVLIACKREPV